MPGKIDAAALTTALPYTQVVTNDSPAAFWRMQESSGNLVESIGSKNGSGTGSGLSYALAGPSASYTALGLSGASLSGWTVGDDNLWSSTTFSIELWCYGSENAANQRFVVAKQNASSSHEWSISYVGSTQTLYGLVTTGSDTVYMMASGTMTRSAWHHVVMTMDATSSNLKLYLDSTLLAQANTPSGTRAGNGSGSLGLGFRPGLSGTGYPWVGNMTLVAFYASVLTPTQVANHFAAISN